MRTGVNALDINIGGTVEFDWGWVEDGARLAHLDHAQGHRQHARRPADQLQGHDRLPPRRHGLFSDLQLVGKRHPIDYALMCIGGHYTMDRVDAVDAAGLVGAKTVIPCHYNTFPVIETDAQAFKSDVESATTSNVIVLDPGQTHVV